MFTSDEIVRKTMDINELTKQLDELAKTDTANISLLHELTRQRNLLRTQRQGMLAWT